MIGRTKTRINAFRLDSSILALMLVAIAAANIHGQAPSNQVAFNRDIRPILADKCFQCHGPDQAKRKADMRLDTEEGVRKVVIPGDPSKSELYQRLTAAEENEGMPPAKAG